MKLLDAFIFVSGSNLYFEMWSICLELRGPLTHSIYIYILCPSVTPVSWRSILPWPGLVFYSRSFILAFLFVVVYHGQMNLIESKQFVIVIQPKPNNCSIFEGFSPTLILHFPSSVPYIWSRYFPQI